jgi:hypothetical protein
MTAEERIAARLLDRLVSEFSMKDSATFRVEQQTGTADYIVKCNRYFDYDRAGGGMGDELVLDGLDAVAARRLVTRLEAAQRAARRARTNRIAGSA